MIIAPTFLPYLINENESATETLTEVLQKKSVAEILEIDNARIKAVEKKPALRCYHGEIDRSIAENRLLQAYKEKNRNGIYLIRKSNKLHNFFVLSLVRDNKAYHYPIKSHANGTFSLLNHSTMDFEDLMDLCLTNSEQMFKTTLSEPLIQDFVPEFSWKRGITTLIHKAVAEATSETLLSVINNPKCPSLSLKNEEGNTPLHLACYMGRDDAVRILLSAGASWNIINMLGWTSLHMAAIGNNPTVIQILRDVSTADLEERNPVNNFTALHCAAACNNSETVQMLLMLGAHNLSLTDEMLTPLEIANQYDAKDCIGPLTSFVPSPPKTSSKEWFHGKCSTQVQNVIEKHFAHEKGIFYVRVSAARPNSYTLCVCWDKKWLHIPIDLHENNLFSFDKDNYYSSLESAVEFFMNKFPDIVRPLSPDVTKNLLSISNDTNDVKRILREKIIPNPNAQTNNVMLGRSKLSNASSSNESRRPSNGWFNNSDNGFFGRHNEFQAWSMHHHPLFNDLSANFGWHNEPNIPLMNKLVKSGIQDHFAHMDWKHLISRSIFSLRSKAAKIPTISATQITFGQLLGEGNFGQVYDGYYTDEMFVTYPVAVKVLKNGIEHSKKKEFLQEAGVMRKLMHPFIVRLYGVVCSRSQLWMVQELLPLGSLHSYLTSAPVIPVDYIRLWTVQVCSGMQYMESKRYVHRDLASRNILLASMDQVKISDFGLSRYTGDSESYEYVQKSNCPIPIPWYAPESFTEYRFTSKSDVWSFGVTIWEMYSNGQHPYGSLSADPTNLLNFLTKGQRLPRPANCSNATWDLLTRCWKQQPDARPSFSLLQKLFSGLSEYDSANKAIEKISQLK